MIRKLVAYWMSTDIGILLAFVCKMVFGKEQPEIKHPTWPETGELNPFGGWFELLSKQGNVVLLHLVFQLEGVTAEEILNAQYWLPNGTPINFRQLMETMLLDWHDYYPELFVQGVPKGAEKGAEYALAARIPRMIRAHCPSLAKRNIYTFKILANFSHPLPRTPSVVEQAEAILAGEI